MAGIGRISDEREVVGGEIRDGGRTIAAGGGAGGGGFDPLRANVDPFKARKIQLENLRPVAEAMRRHEVATKGIEKVSATRLDLEEIQNGNPDGDGNGNFKGKWYSRKDGVWYDPPNAAGLTEETRQLSFAKAEEEIAFRKGERLRGETNDMRTFVDTETARDIEMWRGSCEEAMTVARLGETFARTEQALVNDAGTANASALGQVSMDEANARKLAEVSGGAFDAAAATRERTEQLARRYVRQNLEGRAKAATSFALQSGGLMPPEKAMERANRIYDGMAKDFLDKLVASGRYDHARIFANHAEELGYRGEVKADALEAIDAAERKAQKAAFNGVQATAESAVATGRLNGGVDPQTGATLPGMEDALAAIRGAKQGFAVGTELRANYDRLEAQVDAAADRETARSLENAVIADGSYEPEGAREKKLYPAVKAKVDELRRKDRERVAKENDESLMYDELMLDYEIQSGALSDGEIGRRMRDIHERATALATGRLLKPEDYAAFGKRWKARNAADESAAGVMFDRAFGLSLGNFVDARGDISTETTDKSYKDTLRSGQKAVFPGTDEKVSLGEYLKWRAAFLGQLRELPQGANRRQQAKELLGRFKAGWYARQTEANIEALSRTMNDIHLGIEAEYEAERLRADAEEERRNMPVVDRRHPANAEPQPDPLEFYRRANPLDPTIKYR